MNEHQIECFLNVVDEGNFSKAAAKIHLTQPAITHQIASLEKELKASLFLRHSSGVFLTESGRQFLPAARNLQEAFQNARASIQKPLGRDVPFVMGIPRAMMINTTVYQSLLHSMTESFPEFELEVREVVGGPDIYHALENGIDCIITMDYGVSITHREELKIYPLFQPQCWLSMNKKNPLYPKEQILAEELKGMKLYYASYERPFIDVLKSRIPAGQQINFMEVSSPLTVAPSLLSGTACLISPTREANPYAEHLACLVLEKEMPVTCAFFLRRRIDPVYDSIAKLIQKAHSEQ